MKTTLELTLPEDITSELKKIARWKKESKEDVAIFAIKSYVNALSEISEEFKLWDKLSDEALINFERSIE